MSARDSFERFARWVMRDCTYDRDYAARVEFDHGDQSFDVVVEDATLAGQGLQHVPVAVGIAGTKVRANPGTQCLVGFADRDPRKPRIVAWAYEPNSGRIVFDDGIAGLARQGDPIEVLISNPAPVAGTAGGTQTIPGTPPVVVPIPQAPCVGVVTGILPRTARANIIGGARRLLAT